LPAKEKFESLQRLSSFLAELS